MKKKEKEMLDVRLLERVFRRTNRPKKEKNLKGNKNKTRNNNKKRKMQTFQNEDGWRMGRQALKYI